MSDLPSRDVALGILDGTYDEDNGARIVADLLRLAASGRLVDRDTIDYEAAARWTHAEMVLRGPTDLTWEAAYPEEQADHLFLALGAISAALGDNKTVEELRAAAFGMVTE